ncbi:hypothetical protein IFM89_034235 [Coptis chinensis]|uniref:Uncharacterized protein n=1 Tax=Coptis chinensis TaxID=261450 RepID=A0A835HD01_9MAGN|nr:hypothetical protein IFM89_034235 [Coptis chinensis]
MSEAFEASGFEANESEASETRTKPKGPRFQVEFTADGQATGQYRAKYATIVGQVARTHCPPMYKDWVEVPVLTKDELWKDRCPGKKKLIFHSSEENALFRKRNGPKKVKKDEWEAFVDMCSTEEDKTKRCNGKLAREKMKNSHTTGRMGAAPVIEQLEEINRLVSIESDIVERDLDNDPVAMVIGRDGRGRVRRLGGGITKTVYHVSAPYKEIAYIEKRARESSESGYEVIMAKLDEAGKAREILEDEVADLKRQSSGLGNTSQFCERILAACGYSSATVSTAFLSLPSIPKAISSGQPSTSQVIVVAGGTSTVTDALAQTQTSSVARGMSYASVTKPQYGRNVDVASLPIPHNQGGFPTISLIDWKTGLNKD